MGQRGAETPLLRTSCSSGRREKDRGGKKSGLVHGECALLGNSQSVLWDSSEGSCMVFRSISNYFMPAYVNNYSGTGSQQRAVCSPSEPVQC